MTHEKPELSRKSPYYIPRHRYYELKHFCRQYSEWKKALVRIDAWGTPLNDIQGVIKGLPPESSTERAALARIYYSRCIDIFESCIGELDEHLAPYIRKGVTEGVGYDILRNQGCPCCREIYYDTYRYFFWLLSKERQ